MSWHIRAARAQDRPALAEIYRRASLSNVGDRQGLLQHPDALEFSWRERAQATTRVATRDGRVIGFATVEVDDDHAELEDLFVDPDSMRQGVAAALIHDVVGIARAWGAHRLEVTANAHALEFYRQAGFLDRGMTTTRFGPAQRMRMDLGA